MMKTTSIITINDAYCIIIIILTTIIIIISNWLVLKRPQQFGRVAKQTHFALHTVAGKQHNKLRKNKKIFLLFGFSLIDWFADMLATQFILIIYSPFLVSFCSSSTDTHWQMRKKWQTTMVSSSTTNLARAEKGYKKSLQELDTHARLGKDLRSSLPLDFTNCWLLHNLFHQQCWALSSHPAGKWLRFAD